jgi:cytochrome c-type biogenesis protein CcmH
MTAAARDDLEHQLRCQCGCTLDIFTCRTTDFACRVSPAMHGDIMYLVEGGYSAQEITDAFVRVYGEKALMAPTTEGFNLLGWITPFLVVAGGAVALLALLRSWRRTPATTSAHQEVGSPLAPKPAFDATDEELARLRAEVRNDE